MGYKMLTGLGDYYDGFDMSGYGRGDDRTKEGREQTRRRNYYWLKESYSDEFKDLTMEDFQLHAWKGTIWWGGSWDSLYNASVNKDFTGWSSKEIVEWLIKNRPYISEGDISRIISRESRYKVLSRQRWTCNQCGCKLKYNQYSDWEGEIAHIDHIHPFSLKRTYPNGAKNINELANLQALCPKCNKSKSNKEGFH